MYQELVILVGFLLWHCEALGWGLFGGFDSQEFVKLVPIDSNIWYAPRRPDARERWPWQRYRRIVR